MESSIKYCFHTPKQCGLSSCIDRGCILNTPLPPTNTINRLIDNYWKEMKRLGLNPSESTCSEATSNKLFKRTNNSLEKVPFKKQVNKRNFHRTRFNHLIISGVFVPCHYCGNLLLPHQTSMDHIIPRSKGGGLGEDNIVPACKKCNHTKKDMDYYKFLQVAKDLGIFLRFDRIEELKTITTHKIDYVRV